MQHLPTAASYSLRSCLFVQCFWLSVYTIHGPCIVNVSFSVPVDVVAVLCVRVSVCLDNCILCVLLPACLQRIPICMLKRWSGICPRGVLTEGCTVSEELLSRPCVHRCMAFLLMGFTGCGCRWQAATPTWWHYDMKSSHCHHRRCKS